MAQGTEPANEESYLDVYSVICDAVERAWQHWPVERGADEAPVMHTSTYAREAANRVMDALGEIWDAESRINAEVEAAEHEHFLRLWYFRTVSVKRSAQDLAEVADKIGEIEATYKDLVTEGDFELGVLHGKLSALRWVLGDEWDNYDT